MMDLHSLAVRGCSEYINRVNEPHRMPLRKMKLESAIKFLLWVSLSTLVTIVGLVTWVTRIK
jgi:hypothetical protein